MAAGVLLDTSFLITLADKNRPHHRDAKQYWRYFLQNNIPIYLSTIVVSEFEIKQPIGPEILRHCLLLPFNYQDAKKAASLNFDLFKPTASSRDALKDDVKLIAQACVKDVAFVITDDVETFYKYCVRLKEQGILSFKAIKLQDGFDKAFFANGQRDFDQQLEPPSEEDSTEARPES